LGDKIPHTRHAVAIDERRLDFTPTLWDNLDERPAGTTAKQLWFAGVHADVGGGHFHRGLGDVTLKWMFDEAAQQGLGLRAGSVDVLEPDPRGLLHNSMQGIFARRPSRPRSVPNVADSGLTNTLVSARAHDRHIRPAPAEDHYWQTVDLAPGQSSEVRVRARDRWGRSGVYLHSDGLYSFKAVGDWIDGAPNDGPGGIMANADGALPGFHIKKVGYILGAAWPVSRWWGRRYKPAAWFALIGVVANGAGVDNDTKMTKDHETFLIGQSKTGFSPNGSGYLYCFANDAWTRYGNNKGTLRLTITRTE
jgi:hypothetical protein